MTSDRSNSRPLCKFLFPATRAAGPENNTCFAKNSELSAEMNMTIRPVVTSCPARVGCGICLAALGEEKWGLSNISRLLLTTCYKMERHFTVLFSVVLYKLRREFCLYNNNCYFFFVVVNPAFQFYSTSIFPSQFCGPAW